MNKISARMTSIIGASAIVAIALTGCGSSSQESAASPSPSATAEHRPPTRTPVPEVELVLDPTATCADLETSATGIQDAIEKTFPTDDAVSGGAVAVACKTQLTGDLSLATVVDGLRWKGWQAATPLVVVGGTYDGYSIDVQLNTDTAVIGTDMESPGTALDTTQFMPTMTGSIGIRNTTPQRAFPVGDTYGLSGFTVRGAYPAGSPVCTLNLAMPAGDGCLYDLGTAMLPVDALDVGQTMDLPLSAAGAVLSVTADENVDAVIDALQLPQSIGLIWKLNNSSLELASCRFPRGGNAGDNSYLVLTKPAGEEATFCS